MNKEPIIKTSIIKYIYNNKKATGYDFIRYCRENNIKVSAGTIYPHLSNLCLEGYLKFEENGRKKEYYLTEKGMGLYEKISENNDLAKKTVEKLQLVITCNCENVPFEIKNSVKNFLGNLTTLNWDNKERIIQFKNEINELSEKIDNWINTNF
ncbi:MAG TPA: PadR family transcriptional regulator [Tepiditoga sp.]|nr:PadR family transcriptional regulator [Tepiditoga sp.]